MTAAISNTTLWTLITGIGLFFTYIIVTFLRCKPRFSWNSISILLITFMILATVSLIQISQYPIADQPGGLADTVTKTSRNVAYINIGGFIACLLAIVIFAIKNKSTLYGCGDQFPWGTLLILVVSAAISLLYVLIQYAVFRTEILDADKN